MAKIEHAEGSEEAVRATLTDWHARMISITTASMGGLGAAFQAGESGRQLLGLMITEPIVVTPRYGDQGEFLGWTYTGEAHLGRLAGTLPAPCHQRTGRVRIS
jgi:hypothetical protein